MCWLASCIRPYQHSLSQSINIYWAVCNLTSGKSQVSVTYFWHQFWLCACVSWLQALQASCLRAQWHELSGSLCLQLWSSCCSAPLVKVPVCLITSPRVHGLWFAVYINELIWSLNQVWNPLLQFSLSLWCKSWQPNSIYSPAG